MLLTLAFINSNVDKEDVFLSGLQKAINLFKEIVQILTLFLML